MPERDGAVVVLQDRLVVFIKSSEDLHACQERKSWPQVFVNGDLAALDELQKASGSQKFGQGGHVCEGIWCVSRRFMMVVDSAG